MVRIDAALPNVRIVAKVDADPVDFTQLTSEDQHELCQLLGTVQQLGLAGLSDVELERLCSLRIILDRETEEPTQRAEVACD
jgi:hypothetical protein